MLLEAIESALQQETSVPYEIVIVDNDPSETNAQVVDDIVRSYPNSKIRLFRNEENIGLFGNWNKCIKHARSGWVTILNDDDLLDPSWLDSTYSVVGQLAEIGGVGCAVRDGSTSESSDSLTLLGAIKRVLRWAMIADLSFIEPEDYFISCPHSGSLGMLMHRQAAIDVGGFDPSFYPCADYLFYIKLSFQNRICLLKDNRAVYRKYWISTDGSSENLSGTAEVAVKTGLQNRLIQNALIPHIPIWRRILLKYVGLFSLRSAIGRGHQSDSKIGSKYIIFRYFTVKLFLLLIFKITKLRRSKSNGI
tara:strand:+ start:1437 stop:2354 length:918 start_codon:yes stop_codon:yes gene_type:complete